MRLTDYLSREKLTFESFAHRIFAATGHDTTGETIRQIAAGNRFPRKELAVAIVRATKGDVGWEDLFPRPEDLDAEKPPPLGMDPEPRGERGDETRGAQGAPKSPRRKSTTGPRPTVRRE